MSSRYALSAAHCFVDFDQAFLLAGVHNVLEDDPLYEATIFPSDVIRHAQYNRTNYMNDIALVRLFVPITLNAAVQIVALPARSLVNTDLTNTVGRIAGW